MRRPERLVAADVDEPSRLDGEGVEHVAEKLIGRVSRGAQRDLRDPGVVERRGSSAVAAQLRVGDQGGGSVARSVDLGHHVDESIGRVGHDAGVVVRGEEPAGTAIDVARPADLGESRPAGHGQPPPLVVGEVQVQDVDLVERDQVDVAQDVVDPEEVAGYVEHRPPMLEARAVVDLDAGDVPRTRLHGGRLGGGGQQLAQCRERPKHASRRGGADADARRVGAQRVRLVARFGGRRDGDDDRAGHVVVGNGEGESGRAA